MGMLAHVQALYRRMFKDGEPRCLFRTTNNKLAHHLSATFPTMQDMTLDRKGLRELDTIVQEERVRVP